MVQEHQELTKQNWGFISPEEQAQIARTRVLLVGCGLGSNIAVLAARTGKRRVDMGRICLLPARVCDVFQTFAQNRTLCDKRDLSSSGSTLVKKF